MNLREARSDPEQRQWDLPPWGHPAALMVMPLFMASEGCLIPVGTAFLIGGSNGFVVSADHNVTEAAKNDGGYDLEISSGTLPGNMSLRHTGLSVLHHFITDNGTMRINILPLSSVQGARPTDSRPHSLIYPVWLKNFRELIYTGRVIASKFSKLLLLIIVRPWKAFQQSFRQVQASNHFRSKI
jgi:hypothetical protein